MISTVAAIVAVTAAAHLGHWSSVMPSVGKDGERVALVDNARIAAGFGVM